MTMIDVSPERGYFSWQRKRCFADVIKASIQMIVMQAKELLSWVGLTESDVPCSGSEMTGARET